MSLQNNDSGALTVVTTRKKKLCIRPNISNGAPHSHYTTREQNPTEKWAWRKHVLFLLCVGKGEVLSPYKNKLAFLLLNAEKNYNRNCLFKALRFCDPFDSHRWISCYRKYIDLK